jgi:hypothetical protein
MALDGRDIASLVGWDFRILQALEVNVKLHHSVKLLKLLAVNHDGALDGSKGRVRNPTVEVVDLHGLLEGDHAILSKDGMSMVLFYMGSTVLVEIKILAVNSIMQGLKGCENVRDHGIALASSKEVVVEDPPRLVSILPGSKLLHVLPCA